MASVIHFTSGETIAVTADAEEVIDEIKGKELARFMLAAIPMKVYVAGDEVTYIQDLNVQIPPDRT